jgi:hypothetical protein
MNPLSGSNVGLHGYEFENIFNFIPIGSNFDLNASDLQHLNPNGWLV